MILFLAVTFVGTLFGVMIAVMLISAKRSDEIRDAIYQQTTTHIIV